MNALSRFLFPLLAISLSGCAQRDAPPLPPDPLRIAVRPDKTKETLEATFGPLTRYLGEALGVRAEMVIPKSYEDLRERFHRGEAELALFGGADFVEAEQRDAAIPLVRRVIDRKFTSVAIARSGLEGGFPEAFRGRRFVLGALDATSDHVIPRKFLLAMNVAPERLFGSVDYLVDDDAVIAAIVEGEADAGLVNGHLLRRRMSEGALDPTRFQQVWESPPYCDRVWATPARLSQEIRMRLTDAFLALDISNPAHEKILAPLEARVYVPATRADFEEVRAAMAGKSAQLRP